MFEQLDRMRGIPSQGRSVPDDFGTLLASDSLESHLADIRAARLAGRDASLGIRRQHAARAQRDRIFVGLEAELAQHTRSVERTAEVVLLLQLGEHQRLRHTASP